MIRLALFVALLLVPRLALGGPYADKILATQAASIVGFWKLDETAGTTATDTDGTQNGTYAGGISINQTGPFAEAKAIRSTADAHELNITDNSAHDFGTGNFTGIIWYKVNVNTTGWVATCGPMCKMTNSTYPQGWTVEVAGQHTTPSPCDSSNPCIGLSMRLGDGSGNDQSGSTGGNRGIRVGNWSMVSIKRTGTTCKLAAVSTNVSMGAGVSVTQTSSRNVSNSATTGVNQAFGTDKSTDYSEFSLWNVALDDADIDAIFTCGNTGVCGATSAPRRIFQSAHEPKRLEPPPILVRAPAPIVIEEPFFIVEQMNDRAQRIASQYEIAQ